AARTCPNGHPLGSLDEVCPICGTLTRGDPVPLPTAQLRPPPVAPAAKPARGCGTAAALVVVGLVVAGAGVGTAALAFGAGLQAGRAERGAAASNDETVRVRETTPPDRPSGEPGQEESIPGDRRE